LAVPAHVTRRAYGLLGVLGFIPEGLPIDALEVDQAPPDLTRYPQVRSSDAHRLDQIGAVCTDFWLAEPTVSELRLALHQTSGRRAARVA
jgi:hypothetical protein